MRLAIRAAIVAFGGLMLSSCIDSSAPILSGAAPVFGQQARFQFYTLRDGIARDPQTATYRWNGALYTRTGGGPRDIDGFSAHQFEGGAFIIQTVSARRPRITEYALAQKLVDAVYLVTPIDEADADEATRSEYCSKLAGSACHIEKRDQLFAFARATAAKSHDHGALALKLSDWGR